MGNRDKFELNFKLKFKLKLKLKFKLKADERRLKALLYGTSVSLQQVQVQI